MSELKKTIFTIIIPVYNSELYVGNLLTDLLQFGENNNEIILIDDGSTDNSYLICKEFSSKYDFIKLYTQENKGVSATRNYGISISSGEYIIFLDADDRVPTWFYDNLHNVSTDLTISAFNNVRGKDIVRFGPVENKMYKDRITICKWLIDLDTSQFGWVLNVLWNKIFKKSIIIENNIVFRNICPGEDMVFICEYMQYIHSVRISSKIVYSYYSRDNNSLINSFYSSHKQITRRKMVYSQLKKLYQSFGILDIKILELNLLEGFSIYAAINTITDKKIRIKEKKTFLDDIKTYENFDLVYLYLESENSYLKKIEKFFLIVDNSYLLILILTIKNVIINIKNKFVREE